MRLGSFKDRTVEIPEKKISRIHVVLKIVESEKYVDIYFDKDSNASFLRNKDVEGNLRFISRNRISQLVNFLSEAVQDYRSIELQIDLQGSEPLLMDRGEFESMCEQLHTISNSRIQVRLVLRTSGILIDDGWLCVFIKHKIRVEIEINSRQLNIDNQFGIRKSEEDSISIRGLRILQGAIWDGRMRTSDVGLVYVIDPSLNARSVFSHFVDYLGIQQLNLLMPKNTGSTTSRDFDESLSNHLRGLFDAVMERSDPVFSIRPFKRIFTLLISGEDFLNNYYEAQRESITFTVSVEGELGFDGDLGPLSPGYNQAVGSLTFRKLISGIEVSRHLLSVEEKHADCEVCCWGRICNGGDLILNGTLPNISQSGSLNKIIYCESIKSLLTHMTEFAVRKGVPFDHIQSLLITEYLAPED